jgi:hypothetical protein
MMSEPAIPLGASTGTPAPGLAAKPNANQPMFAIVNKNST